MYSYYLIIIDNAFDSVRAGSVRFGITLHFGSLPAFAHILLLQVMQDVTAYRVVLQDPPYVYIINTFAGFSFSPLSSPPTERVNAC